MIMGCFISMALFSQVMMNADRDSSYNAMSLNGSLPSASIYHDFNNANQLTPNSITAPVNVVDTFQCYPNPVRGYLNIDLDATEPISMQLQLIDLSGRTVSMVYQGTLNGPYHTTLNTTGMPRGAYIMRLISLEGTILKKILVD